MKKVLGLIVLALAACMAVVAVMETRGAQAGLSLDTYKCYKARHAKQSPRFQPERVFLTDQFRHNVEVSVLKINTHCSRADQEILYDGTSASQFSQGLNCYNIRDVPRQPRFEPQNIRVRDKLTNWSDHVLTVSKAQSLCAFSIKSTDFKGTLEGDAFVCYQAKTAKGQPRFQQRDLQVFDQFAEKDVRVIRPVAYCSLAEKKIDAPNDDFQDARQLSENDLQSGFFFEDHASTVHSTLQDNDPIISCKTDYTHSVWYDWTGGENLSLMVDTQGSSYDTVVAVFTGDKGNLDEVACNDDVDLCQNNLLGAEAAGCGPCINGAETAGCVCPPGAGAAGCLCQVGDEAAGCMCETGSETAGVACCIIRRGVAGGNGCEQPTSSFVQFDAWAGTEYHILVASSEGRGGKLKFHILRKDDAGSADSCTGPYYLSPLEFEGHDYTTHLSTMNAQFNYAGVSVAGGICGDEDPDVSCAGTYGASVWFTYTPGSHQLVNFDTFSTSYPNFIAIYDQGNGSAQVACGGSGFASAQLKDGHKYLILVGSTDEDNNYRGGKLKLNLELKDELGSSVPVGQNGGVGEQGQPDSLTCYQVRQARHSNATERSHDQFSLRQLDYFKGPGYWTLIVGGVDSLCVPSNKTTCTGQDQFLTGEGEAAELCVSP